MTSLSADDLSDDLSGIAAAELTSNLAQLLSFYLNKCHCPLHSTLHLTSLITTLHLTSLITITSNSFPLSPDILTWVLPAAASGRVAAATAACSRCPLPSCSGTLASSFRSAFA